MKLFFQITKVSISWFLFIALAIYHLCFVLVVYYGYDFRIPDAIRFRSKIGRNPNDRVQFLLEDLQNNVERMKETLSHEETLTGSSSIQPELEQENYLMGYNDLSTEPKIEKYPEVSDMKRSIINGTFDWSKTAKSVLFLKKHQCSDSLLRESLRNETFSLPEIAVGRQS